MQESTSGHGPLTVSKGWMHGAGPGRERVPGDTHPSSVSHWLPLLCAPALLLWRPSRGASEPWELLADAFPCFSSYLTWQTLAPFYFQTESLYRCEKNRHTRQWINNSCQLAARAITVTLLPSSVLIACKREFVLKLLIFKLHVKTTNCTACWSNKA